MSSSMMQIHGPVKKSGDRIAVHGVSFAVLEGKIFGLLGLRVAARPWSFAKFYTNFTQIFSLSYNFSSLPAILLQGGQCDTCHEGGRI